MWQAAQTLLTSCSKVVQSSKSPPRSSRKALMSASLHVLKLVPWLLRCVGWLCAGHKAVSQHTMHGR